MTNERDDDRAPRRRLLKKLAAGGSVASLAAMPGKWAKPVVASVVLPAHAQISPQGCAGTLGNCPPGYLFSDSGSTNTTKYFGSFPVDLLPGVTVTNGTLSGSGGTQKYTDFGACPTPCDDAVASKYLAISGSFGNGNGTFGVNGEYRCGGEPVYSASLSFVGTNVNTALPGKYTGNFSYNVEGCYYLYGDSTVERQRSRRGLRNFQFGK